MKFVFGLAVAVALASPATAQDGDKPQDEVVQALVEQAASADLAAAEALYRRACAQCHGRTGRGMASFPSLEGKEVEHIVTRLVQYRAGETVGPNSGLMRPVAARLADDDIANLAAFISARFE